MSLVVSTKNDMAWAGSTAPTYTADGVTLNYATDGDANGLFYYIGTNGLVGAWANPITSLLVAYQTASSTSNTVNALVDRAASAFYINSVTNNFVGFDLGTKYLMAVNKYTIRSRSEASHNMKNWKIQGSNNVGGTTVSDYQNATWEDIDTRTDDTFLINADVYHTYTANGETRKRYRWLRILQTGPNHSGGEFLCLGEVEFYGSVKVAR